MARKRMLSPEVFTSPTVSAWPATTRWTWVGLLCYLDDYGYGEDSPELVKAVVWPRDRSYSAKKVAADIDLVSTAGSLCRFTCCDRPAMHIPRWQAWQKVAHPSAARFCPCPLHDRAAHEGHMRDTRGSHAALSTVEVSEGQRSLGGEPTDPTPEGSVGLTAAKGVVAQLRQKSGDGTAEASA